GTKVVSRPSKVCKKVVRRHGCHSVHVETATAGPRTVPPAWPKPLRRGEGPVRSSIAGGKPQECFRPPRPSDVLRAGTARAPVGVSRGAHFGLAFVMKSFCAIGVRTRDHSLKSLLVARECAQRSRRDFVQAYRKLVS